LLLVLAACGGKTAPHPCESSVAGQTIASGGIAFVAKSAVATAGPGFGFVIASENACGDRGTHLAVYPGSAATGSYSVTRDKLAASTANAILFSGSEAGPGSVWASSGTVSVLTLDSPRRLVATYDLVFPDGAHYAGGVDVPFCFNGDMCR
jgi:hypothetical protein